MPLIRPSALFAALLFFTAEGVLHAQVPPAEKITPVSVSELGTTTEAGRWVKVEAFIWIWRYTAPVLELRINSRDAWSTARVHVDDAAQLPKALQGAKIRLIGKTSGRRTGYDGLEVPSLAQMEVLQSGSDDLFGMPRATFEDVAKHRHEWGSRVTVKGTVVARAGSRDVWITHGGIGLNCNLTLGWTPNFGPSDIAGGTTVVPEMIPGDEVEITGSLVEKDQGRLIPYELSYCHARVIGKSPAPEPRAVPLSHLAKFKEHSEWTCVEGTVDSWMWDGSVLNLSVTDPGTNVLVAVGGAAQMTFPEDLFGARVRLTGMTRAMLPNAEFNLSIPDPQLFEVVRPGTKNVFDAPESTPDDVVRHAVPPAERVRVRGVLLARLLLDVIQVRDKDSAVNVKLGRTWQRGSSKTARYADGGAWPDNLNAGDEVEVVGTTLKNTPDESHQPYDLIVASVRVIHRGTGPPAPRQATLDDIIAGSFTSELVQTRGRLMSFDQMPVERGYWRTTLRLESATGTVLHAVSYSPKPAIMTHLHIDDEVLIQGIVGRATAQSLRQIWFASPLEDVKSLGASPVVISQQIWRWAGGGAALLIVLLGWIGLLRRSNQQKTRIAAELKAASDLLEQRVAERTAELSKAHEELNDALAQERELGELKSRFVTMVSHEFRTPLGVTMSAIEIMRQFDERLSAEKRRELCDEIYTSTCNMAGLMEQVLLLGCVEAGKLGFKPAAIDLDDILRRLIDETQSVTHRKCPILLQIDSDLGSAKGDEALLRHIFSNLISNGVKYSPEAQAVEVRLRRDGLDAVIEVADHGIGIPEADIVKLFDAFHRAGNVGHIPGTGLGMTIVKRCVELHRGLITVKSEVGRGTTFTVRLPLFESTRPTPVT